MKKNMEGRRFGHLTVLERTSEKEKGCYKWLCQCDCGNKVSIAINRLTSGHRTSCGCRKNAYREMAKRIIQHAIYSHKV